MKERMTPQEFANKIEEIGSLYRAVTDHGLSEVDLNRLDDPLLYDQIKEYVVEASKLREIEFEIDDALDDYLELE